jgi:Cro/C1-type HTH DNA-binding domain
MAKSKPKRPSRSKARGRRPAPISDAIREVIRRRGLTAYAVAKAAGILPHVVGRFLDAENPRDLRLKTADKIAAALGLVVVEQG